MFTQPFAIPAVILFLISVPLAMGVIPRNRLYGFRTKRTLADESIWIRVNRFMGFGIMIAGAVYYAVALARPYDHDFSVWLLHLAAFAIPLVVALTLSAAYAKRS
jgi:uncharacterized membrane protein